MKFNFVPIIIMLSKWAAYGFCMQLLFFNMIIAGTAVGQKSASVKEVAIALDLRNSTISKLFKEIETKTDFRFSLDRSELKSELNNKISITDENIKVADVLMEVSKYSGIKFKQVNNNINVRKIEKGEDQPAEFEIVRIVKDIDITGKITDENGEGLPGASVVVKGTSQGTTTDIEGNFKLTAPDEAILTISFVGYTTLEVPVGGRSTIDTQMQLDAEQLDEVVVVGYGTVNKSDLTGSVSSVSSDKVTQVKAISNLAQTLQGQAAGVQVTQRSGQPGENISIIIRGNNSIQASNNPLYVVDGLPLNGLTADLNPNDIYNIEVLKDASSTAIYGSRGANGVIMITTKKGIEGKPHTSYSGYYGVQSLRKKIDLINAEEFALLQNEVASNDGTPLPWTQAEISAFGDGTDWQDLVYQNAAVQNHDLSVSGGNQNTKFYTSLGYYNQEGIIANSGFSRYSFRTNLDHKLNDRLSATVSLSLQQSDYAQNNYFNADGGGGVPFTTMVMPPIEGVYNTNGDYSVFTGVPWGQTNPYALSQEEVRENRSFRIIGNAAINYEIITGLKLKLSFGIDNDWNRYNYYAPIDLSLYNNGGASKNFGIGTTITNENILNYTKKIDQHNLDIVGGYTYQAFEGENLNSGTFRNFLSDIYEFNNLSAAQVKPTNTNSGNTDNKLISYLGRINYSFANKYLVTFTGRYDGSSRFSKTDKFAFFPSGALGWRMSEEEFIQNVKSISNLKLRVSYGIVGNQGIDSYQTLGELRAQSITLNNLPTTSYYLSRLENNSLKWETTKQLDIGVDFGLFNDRVQFTADYYDKKTSDLLLNVTLPPNTGFTSSLQNVGSVSNKGFEFQLMGRILASESLNWNSTLTFTSNKTKILDLGKDALGNPITYKEVGTGGNWFPLFLGESMQQLYGYKVIGVYQTDDEAVANGEPTKKAGNYKFQNTDGNDVVDGNDRVILSNFQPKFTFGFNNNLSFRNFNLSVLIVGSVGNDIANEFRKYNITLNGKWTPSREAYEQRWVAGSGGNFDRPSANSGSDIRDYANSLWVENGSYLRFRDITFSYNLPTSFLDKLGLSSSQFYISAQNFITITGYTGYDPESSWDQSNITPRITGWDRGTYPTTKSVILGWKFNF